MKRLVPALLAVVMLVGCGGGDDSTTPVRVYLLRDGKVWPTAREVESGSSVQAETLAALFEGPTSEESEELGAETAIPGGGPTLTVENGLARLEPAGQYSTAALAQIVYTLTQFPTIEAVEVDKRYTRADFEEQTPSVLVESPLPFEEVASPITATGTANTFEANFNYELLDGDGNVVDKNFVTATSGTGTRGTFEFTTGEFDDISALVVFENSAEDGSRIHEVEIPLTAAP